MVTTEKSRNIPTILVGHLIGASGKKEVHIVIQHDGAFRFGKHSICEHYETISTCVHGALSQVMGVLKEIGAPDVNISNGTHLFEGRELAPCDPIPPDIFEEFVGRIELWARNYLTPTQALVPVLATN